MAKKTYDFSVYVTVKNDLHRTDEELQQQIEKHLGVKMTLAEVAAVRKEVVSVKKEEQE